MSSDPQWKSFQPPASMNQDSAIIDFNPPVSSNGKSPPSFNFRNSTSYGDYPAMSQEKSSSFGGPFCTSSSSSSAARTSARFPIGTFSLDNSNMFNSGDNLNSPSSNNVFSNGNSTYEPNSTNTGTRETGIIEKLLHSYGFIQCCERQARLFFHFSQFGGNIEHLKIGDPVEFEMTYDRRTGKPIASMVTKIAPEVVLSEERVTGTVTTELKVEGSGGDTQGRISYENRGECFFLPYTKDDVEGNVTLRSGDKVSFQIATNQRGNLGACHIRLENPVHPVKYQGVVCSMKESFGFIERADVVKEIFFHFSEAKNMKDELQLGDDVEFIIQTRNGKEVACNITRLTGGTVIFEDVGTEIVKGQVLKPLDRGQNVRHQSDPLPGRIRYRAADHSEVEIPFGDKDQKGDFTLRHGDWVQFVIATDRRDQLQRATGISLLDESFVVSGEKREQGVVATIKDGFGFLRCVEREPRLFFHFNEVLEGERAVRSGDEFEFTVIQDQSSTFANNRQSAIRMKRLPPGTVKFETLSEGGISGTITKEIPLTNWSNRSPTKNSQSNGTNGVQHAAEPMGLITYQVNGAKKTINFMAKDFDSKFAPRMGDKVEFDVCVLKRNKELVAMNIRRTGTNPALHQGFIAALKDGFGFIETAKHDKEVFFHYSHFDGDVNSLKLGLEVEYTLGMRRSSGSCSSAENVCILPNGTIDMPAVLDEWYCGVVARPVRSLNPEQAEYSGLITLTDEESEEAASKEAAKEGLEQSTAANNEAAEVKEEKDNASVDDDDDDNRDDEDDEDDDDGDDAEEKETKEEEKKEKEKKAKKLKEKDVTGEEAPPAKEYEFGITSLAQKREVLQIGDQVRFQLDEAGRAANVQAVRKKLRATVDTIKGQFGFLNYEVDEGGRKLFFHTSEVKDNVKLKVGDTVEFVLVTNHSKTSACNIVTVVQARPERLISRLRTTSLDDTGPKLTVVRQPKGPDGTRGFTTERTPRIPGTIAE